MTPKKVLKTFNLIKMGSFGHGKAFGGMVGRCMPKYGHGGPLGNLSMTILGSYVGSHFPKIGNLNVYGGI